MDEVGVFHRQAACFHRSVKKTDWSVRIHGLHLSNARASPADSVLRIAENNSASIYGRNQIEPSDPIPRTFEANLTQP